MKPQLLIVLFFSVLICNAQKTIEEVEKEILTVGTGPQINSFLGILVPDLSVKFSLTLDPVYL